MFPLRDDNPTLHKSVMTFIIIAANVFCWLVLQGAGTQPALVKSLMKFGAIPGELFGHLTGGLNIPLGHGITFTIDGKPHWITVLSSMFMHGGWFHIIGNMWFLAVFGDNVEDALGPVKFLIFYLVCGAVAFGVQSLTDMKSPIPMVGASGAISGVLGAYLVLYPRAPIHTMIFFGWIWVVIFPAYIMIGYWFLLQIISGIPALSSSGGGVAFWAHIGGFVAGVLLILIFGNKQRIEECRNKTGVTTRFVSRAGR
jgi:membrane associated rhomboid family serine protease